MSTKNDSNNNKGLSGVYDHAKIIDDSSRKTTGYGPCLILDEDNDVDFTWNGMGLVGNRVRKPKNPESDS